MKILKLITNAIGAKRIKQIALWITLLTLLIPFQGFAQILNDLPPNVKEYVNKLNSYRENVTVTKEEFSDEIEPEGLQKVDMLQLTIYKISKKIDNLSSEEFKDLVNLRNEAVEEDPYKLKDWFSFDGKETSKNLNINSNNVKIKLAAIDKMILNRISKIYNKEIADLHNIPLLAKVKIIERSDEIYEGVRGIKTNVTNYNVIVEDICRGHNILKVGSQMTFYLMNQWKKTKNNFEIGKSYFVGFFAITDDFGKMRLALATNELNDGIYPIENNKVIDPDNSSGINGELLWETFKSKITNVLDLNY